MAWKKSPPELVALFERVRPPEEGGVEHRVMFGYPCCVLYGHMFAGLHQDSLILRLSGEDIEAFLKLPGAAPFEPMPGRPMRGFVTAPQGMLQDEPTLRGWVDRALACARQLPPKHEGKRRTARRR